MNLNEESDFVGKSLKLANLLADQQGLLPLVYLHGVRQEKRRPNPKRITFVVDDLGNISSAKIG